MHPAAAVELPAEQLTAPMNAVTQPDMDEYESLDFFDAGPANHQLQLECAPCPAALAARGEAALGRSPALRLPQFSSSASPPARSLSACLRRASILLLVANAA